MSSHTTTNLHPLTMLTVTVTAVIVLASAFMIGYYVHSIQTSRYESREVRARIAQIREETVAPRDTHPAAVAPEAGATVERSHECIKRVRDANYEPDGAGGIRFVGYGSWKPFTCEHEQKEKR